jgi:hypothetical protein
MSTNSIYLKKLLSTIYGSIIIVHINKYIYTYFFSLNYPIIISEYLSTTNENKSYACEIKVGYKLVVGITWKSTYVFCSYRLMNKYFKIMKE